MQCNGIMFLGDEDKMMCLVCEELWGINLEIKPATGLILLRPLSVSVPKQPNNSSNFSFTLIRAL